MLRPLVALIALVALGVSAFAKPSKRPQSPEKGSLKPTLQQTVKKKAAKPIASRRVPRP
jgi:hypothetical protein